MIEELQRGAGLHDVRDVESLQPVEQFRNELERGLACERNQRIARFRIQPANEGHVTVAAHLEPFAILTEALGAEDENLGHGPIL